MCKCNYRDQLILAIYICICYCVLRYIGLDVLQWINKWKKIK